MSRFKMDSVRRGRFGAAISILETSMTALEDVREMFATLQHGALRDEMLDDVRLAEEQTREAVRILTAAQASTEATP